MTIGIYCILNVIDNKRYIGKSINIEARWRYHTNLLTKKTMSKDCNRYLYNAVQKYKIENFKFIILEKFVTIDENNLKDCELKWMDFYNTCNAKFGYNLRRDSSTSYTVHEDTLELLSLIFKGESNPNFGNKWTDEQKSNMSIKQKKRHAEGIYYGDNWRKSKSVISTNTWKNEKLKQQMANRVSKSKTLYDFYQFNLNGMLIRIYNSIHEVINENPGYKWQNIYAACNGNKPTYMGFEWSRVKKNTIW